MKEDIPEEAKYIGGVVKSMRNYHFKNLAGCYISGILSSKNGLKWFMVKCDGVHAHNAGVYPKETYSSEKGWQFYPSSIDFTNGYFAALVKDIEAELPTNKSRSDSLAVGNEGETQGYLAGCSGLKFL